MEQKIRQTNERSRIRRYRLLLFVVLLLVIILMGWYCVDSYQNTITPKGGTLVDSGKHYERKV